MSKEFLADKMIEEFVVPRLMDLDKCKDSIQEMTSWYDKNNELASEIKESFSSLASDIDERFASSIKKTRKDVDQYFDDSVNEYIELLANGKLLKIKDDMRRYHSNLCDKQIEIEKRQKKLIEEHKDLLEMHEASMRVHQQKEIERVVINVIISIVVSSIAWWILT